MSHRRTAARVALIAGATLLAPILVPSASGQESGSGLPADLIRDVQSVETKYLDLARAIPASSYDWRPMEGVRSVGEVFCHVAGANYRIPGFFGVEQPADAAHVEQLCATANPEEARAGAIEALRRSFEFATNAISAVDPEDLDEPTTVFGRASTYRGALLLYVTHMHEHLGQSIAYARSNRVTPPWSVSG